MLFSTPEHANIDSPRPDAYSERIFVVRFFTIGFLSKEPARFPITPRICIKNEYLGKYVTIFEIASGHESEGQVMGKARAQKSRDTGVYNVGSKMISNHRTRP